MSITKPVNAALFYTFIAFLLLWLAPYSPGTGPQWALFPAQVGEHWRLLSAHFSHDSWTHWWTNFAAFACFLVVFFRQLDWREIALLSATLLFANSVFLEFFYQRDFYLGFSGLLYGWFIYASLRTLGQQTVLSVCILVYLLGKMVFAWLWPEQVAQIEGLDVASEVHVLNSLVALMCFVLAGVLRHSRANGNDASASSV